MNRKRQLEYQVRILEQCKEGQTKLQIMAQTQCSHQQFIKDSTRLHAHGYLRKQGTNMLKRYEDWIFFIDTKLEKFGEDCVCATNEEQELQDKLNEWSNIL